MFKIDGVIIDRISMGVAEDFSGNILYTLAQLADGTIDVTAESKEARDANGTLIRTFFTSKSGTFTANNAYIDFNILAESSGSAKQVASDANKIRAPKVITVKVGTQTVDVPGMIDGTLKVVGIAGNGTLAATYTMDTTAGAKTYSIADNVLTLPTDNTVANFVIKYDRDATSGIKVINRADKFPKTIKLTLKALAIDPCTPDTLRACLIVFPSFQVSPETSISLTTDTQLAYTGNLQVDFCGGDKVLYEIYFMEDDVENE